MPWKRSTRPSPSTTITRTASWAVRIAGGVAVPPSGPGSAISK
jgi:hypothetical protein